MRLSPSRFVLASLLGSTLALSPVAMATPATACGEKTAAPNKTVPADAAKVELAVAGMTCDGCANALHNALIGTAGVFAAEVTFASGKAVVSYDATKLKVDDLLQVISKAGYKGTAGKS